MARRTATSETSGLTVLCRSCYIYKNFGSDVGWRDETAFVGFYYLSNKSRVRYDNGYITDKTFL